MKYKEKPSTDHPEIFLKLKSIVKSWFYMNFSTAVLIC